MPVVVEELFDSPQFTTGVNPGGFLRYKVTGSDSEFEVRAALYANSPSLYDPHGSGLVFYPREDVTPIPVGPGLWYGVVTYGPVPQQNESEFAFDTGGGTQHLTQSIQTRARYAPPGKTAPDYKGAIGHNGDAIEGVDIPIPQYQFSETHYLSNAAVTQAYKLTLAGLTGMVNISDFRGFPGGEVLFLGASGSRRRAREDWAINFRFSRQPNVEGLVIGDIVGINKFGWDYLWVLYEDAEAAGVPALIKRPRAVYVEQVFYGGNFAGLGIGS